MSFFASLCCSSSDRPSKIEAESRHARIVAATSAVQTRGDRSSTARWAPTYQESPPAYHDIAQQPLLSIDEKQPINFQLTVQDSDDPPPPPSPRSSVVSIPSTRLTGLTAAPTGETVQTSRRESLEQVSTRGTLPPYSYYSRRSPSPASSAADGNEGRERDAVWRHPVMVGDWLDVLRQDAVHGSSRRPEPTQRDGALRNHYG